MHGSVNSGLILILMFEIWLVVETSVIFLLFILCLLLLNAPFVPGKQRHFHSNNCLKSFRHSLHCLVPVFDKLQSRWNKQIFLVSPLISIGLAQASTKPHNNYLSPLLASFKLFDGVLPSPPPPLPVYTASCYELLGSAVTPRRLGRSAGGPLTTVGSDCGEVLGWLLLLGGRTLQADGREEKCHWLLLLHLCFFPCCCCWKRHLGEGIHSFHFYIA